jgi:prephenate dehydratase
LGLSSSAACNITCLLWLAWLQKLTKVGAVCSRRAADLYGLEVLAEGIQDVKDNITRFIVLSR